ncbi:zinc ribbon domain-containing protein [Lacisediminihabitans changchengi]|uniref:Zinc ribbon domain-containing protein n=1 Tax=Lacisediminihabitans changchengi TaxID=2787634 RepID=A0A934W3X1_9MICO|nr:zinc ribbon domain-containing protein [Lacisediminihabitans changchengi]MBK4348331.1 zinc ribbon domain-containing protein [Lacisediminihabitans changchengi]
MATCENCNAELQPQWKFCVRCGTKVAPGSATPAPVIPALAIPATVAPAPVVPAPVTPAPLIPAAIRPHELSDDVEPPARRSFDWHVLVGILVGVVGAAAIIYLIVALTNGGN